jgi:hypothetical protein
MPSGYFAVDYAMLGLRVITLEAWRKNPGALLPARTPDSG